MASKLSAMEMLNQKYERKAELKDKELEVRKMEIELQKRKFEEESEGGNIRFKMEMDERKLMLKMLQDKMQN